MKKGWRIALTVVAVILVLGLAPVIVKAATDGEIDIYAELQAQLQAALERIGILESEVAELKAEKADREAQEPPAEPDEPGSGPDDESPPTGEGEGLPSPDDWGSPPIGELPTEPSADMEPDPEPEPEPEPEPHINPYAHLNLDSVHICTIDSVAYFGRWLFDTNGVGIKYVAHTIAEDKAICYKDVEKARLEDYLTNNNIAYTVTELYVDPLFDQIVAGKIFGSRTDAIRYIESHIRHEPFRPDNPQPWHYSDPYYYQNWKE